MNIDTILLVVLAAFFLIGFVRGFIREIGAFIGFFVSLWIAGHYYMTVVPYIRPSLAQWPFIADSLSVVLAFFGAFIASQIVFGFVIKILDFAVRRLAPVPFLKTTNRLAGGAVGVCEGLLFLSAILFVLMNFPINKDISAQLEKSKLAREIVKAAKLITPLLPNISSFAPSFLPASYDPKVLEQLQALQKQFDPKILDSLKNIDLSRLDLKALGIDEKTLPPELRQALKR